MIASDAIISPCGQYRWWLYRWLGAPDSDTLFLEYRPVVFVMLNPSTADAFKPDPTVTRCIGFGRELGCNALIVVNLFAVRTPKPNVMRKHAEPVGEFNDIYIKAALDHAVERDGIIIAAWGRNAETVMGRRRVQALAPLFKQYKMHALDFTKAGTPGHPLMLPCGSPLQPWAA